MAPEHTQKPAREDTLTARETAVSAREHAGVAREDAVALREAADRAREEAATFREEAVHAREEAGQARAELETLMSQLREANEHLIGANLRSQALAEDAETANRHKDEFIANVSHELRTPLNAVLGWVRMLASKQLPEPRAVHAIQTIERNAASLALIIDDLLDMSRIVAGTLKLTCQPLDMVALTKATLDVVRPMAAAKHVELMWSTDASLSDVVNGDPHRLQQVIGNLLTNAIKFTPDGGTVDVSVAHAGSQIEVRVADTGCGITADFLPYVFERYRQADRSLSRQQGGLGLGLAIVRQIVELHGGTVHATSQGEGRGATFVMRLPVLAGIPAERWSALERRLTISVDSPPLRTQRLDHVEVLVVDDQVDGRAVTSQALTEAGAVVTAVATAQEALRHVREQGPHVLVSDLGLPGEDGYALVRQIREHEALHGGFLPAIALTGFARAEDRDRVLAAGFQAHVSKPLDPAELTGVIAGLVGASASAAMEPTEPSNRRRGRRS